jgi:hypothetical protein
VIEFEAAAAGLETGIKTTISQEAEIFRGGGGRRLEATNRLSALRDERQAKARELERDSDSTFSAPRDFSSKTGREGSTAASQFGR